MAGNETKLRVRAKRKRETNAQRRERERDASSSSRVALWIAWKINERRLARLPQAKRYDLLWKLANEVSNSATFVEDASTENIAKGLRLAADMIERKPEDGRKFSAHDYEIRMAFLKAGSRAALDCPSRARIMAELAADGGVYQITWAQPTFAEFLSVYRERSPQLKIRDHTLRRTLHRLQLSTVQSKRGPKGK